MNKRDLIFLNQMIRKLASPYFVENDLYEYDRLQWATGVTRDDLYKPFFSTCLLQSIADSVFHTLLIVLSSLFVLVQLHTVYDSLHSKTLTAFLGHHNRTGNQALHGQSH